jgi:uncharacterized protein
VIESSLLEVLGCPLEPERPPFRVMQVASHTYLVCDSCGSAFPVKDGIPYLLPEDAIPQEQFREIPHAQ